MALTKKGRYRYGTTPEAVQAEITRYSRENTYLAQAFAMSVCDCGGHAFQLATDEDAGVAERRCEACGAEAMMGDSAEYAEEADTELHECVCGEDVFELHSGVALYDGSRDVRWYYIGCRCIKCNLVGVFADWKCEAGNADEFLAKV